MFDLFIGLLILSLSSYMLYQKEDSKLFKVVLIITHTLYSWVFLECLYIIIQE